MKTHLSINVADVARSVEFYKKMFGVEPVKLRDDYAKFDLAEPPLNFTMNRRPVTGGGGPLSHLGLQVESTAEVLAMGRRWQENGLVTLAEMQTDCCYALQDKTWVQDPDGNRWEVFVVLGNTEPAASSAAGCCGPAAETVSISRSPQTAGECR